MSYADNEDREGEPYQPIKSFCPKCGIEDNLVTIRCPGCLLPLYIYSLPKFLDSPELEEAHRIQKKLGKWKTIKIDIAQALFLLYVKSCGPDIFLKNLKEEFID